MTAMTLDELERQAVEAALASTGFNLNAAAALLGMGRTTLARKVQLYGLRRKPLSTTTPPMALADLERAAMEAALVSTRCNVAEAARRLGISRSTLIRKVKAHGVCKAALLARAVNETPAARRAPTAHLTPAVRRKRKARQLASGKCLRCRSPVRSVQGPGRKYRYRGKIDVVIPDDFPTDTCMGCGELYLTDRDVSELELLVERRVHEARTRKQGTRESRA